MADYLLVALKGQALKVACSLPKESQSNYKELVKALDRRFAVAALVSLSKTLNHNCFVIRMGRKAVGPVCCVMHVKEPRTLIVKEKGLAPVFLDSRLDHPAGWICARYKSYHYYYYY